jgi:hypothetical protein
MMLISDLRYVSLLLIMAEVVIRCKYVSYIISPKGRWVICMQRLGGS